MKMSVTDDPNYVLKFNDGVMAPKKESAAKDVVKILLMFFCFLLLILLFAFGFDALNEIPLMVWVCVLLGIGVLIQQGGYERRPSPCELRFYDDYLVQYCERRYYNRRNIRKEYYKFYYKDISRCVYRTVVNKMDIYGVVEATFYKYDKNGNLPSTPCKHKTVDSISVFYTVFEPNIDFVKEIEEHSPIKVQFERS
jgi:hypothetical protein